MFMNLKLEKCHRTMCPANTTNNDSTNNERRFQPKSSSPVRLGFPRPQGHRECRQTTTNDTAHHASVGYARVLFHYWRATASFRVDIILDRDQSRTRITRL